MTYKQRPHLNRKAKIMKKLKNILIALLVLSLTLGLFSCKRNKDGGDESDTAPVAPPISFLDYAVIRPDNISDALLNDISDMYMSLIDLSGKDNLLASDFLPNGQEPDSETREILIGHTNRPETEQVLSQLAGNEYAIAVIGNKIVITGIADSLTPMALEYFVSTYLGDGADGMIEGDLFYKASTETAVIVDKGEPVYTLVRGEAEYEGMVDLCYEVSDAIYFASGVTLPIKTDRLTTGASHDDNAFEILFGDVTYSQTQDLKPNVDPDGYNIEFIGNKIVIYAWNAESMEKAVAEFANMLTYACYTNAEGKTTVCIPKQRIIGKNNDVNYYMDIPYEVNGNRYDNVYDCSDGGMMLYWNEVGEEIFSSYASALEGMGYTRYQDLDNTSVGAATYYKDKASVHIYYLKRTKEFRVVTQNNAVLPVNSYDYEKVCSPAVTQIGIYNDEKVYTGMSYLIRLEDGTFVVIDGGIDLEYNAKILYDTMVEQKPEEFDDIVISAWILTHGHTDHFGALKNFINNYSNKVTVKMLIGNDVSDTIYALTEKSTRGFDFNSVRGKFGGCVYMKAHTGQQFFFPGATFTIMYTHEDVYPRTMNLFNDFASTMFDAVIDDTRFIWLADMENASAKRFKEMYASDMKCDVLQMGHHGIGGASYDVYSLCNPSVAFWPAGAAVTDNSGWWNLAQNKFLREKVGEDNLLLANNGNQTIWFDNLPNIGGLQGAESVEGSHTKDY